MLEQSYQNHIIGYNYISLIKGILALKEGQSTLITSDKRLVFANQWFLNIGYIERAFLMHMGEVFDIEALQDIDSYIQEQNSLLYLKGKLFELSNSPYLNIKEIARKLPESLGDFFKHQLEPIERESFDRDFFLFLDQISVGYFKSGSDFDFSAIFHGLKTPEIRAVIERFHNFIESDTLMAKQLHYVIQVMYQTVFSSRYEELETKYLFLSLISPRYQVDGDSLANDLLYEYRRLGGDLKETEINDWGIKNNRLEYVQLNSIDGNVKVEKSFYFAQDHHYLPFCAKLQKNAYRSIVVECVLDHEFIDFFKNKRIVFAPQNRMGSDFPFWELQISEQGKLRGIYSFADYQGTKASFYYPAALDDIFESVKMILPGIKKSDWVSRARLSKGQDIWFEFSPDFKRKLPKDKEQQSLLFSQFTLKEGGQTLRGITHCGPDRARSKGLYSYLIDLFSN